VQPITRSPGSNRADIFCDDADRQISLVIFKGVVEAYGRELRAYCLMRKHVHLVVQTPRPNVGRGMQRLLMSSTVRSSPNGSTTNANSQPRWNT
jgi:REP element-mobilizing transposase RayT